LQCIPAPVRFATRRLEIWDGAKELSVVVLQSKTASPDLRLDLSPAVWLPSRTCVSLWLNRNPPAFTFVLVFMSVSAFRHSQCQTAKQLWRALHGLLFQ